MPKRVILIAAVTVDGYIARHELEMTNWSKDLHVFKQQTMGYPVIMGSNTHKTLSSELVGRESIVVNRGDEPQVILNNISAEKCFIIGGGRTYLRFIKNLTHLYVTPHPYIFGEGIHLFHGKNNTQLKLQFKKLVEIDSVNGIFQYQYRVK